VSNEDLKPYSGSDATWTGANDKRFTRIEALRRGSLAMLIALSVQTGLGLAVNIYATIPKSDDGAGLVAAIGRAVSNGPIGLAIHGVLGLVLLVMSVSLLVRAVIARDRFFLVTAVVGLLLVLGAAASGADFVGHGHDASSLTMGELTAAAQIIFGIALFRHANRAPSSEKQKRWRFGL
jgi:hypothetical protein